MKFDIIFERVYPHSPDAVWHALTDAAALGQWLMRTNFVPEAGRAFAMWCTNPDGGTDRYKCEVISIEPMSRMLWSWLLDGRTEEGKTFVEFKIDQLAEGTRLTIRHSGDRDQATIDAFKSGWPDKLDVLANVVTDHEVE